MQISKIALNNAIFLIFINKVLYNELLYIKTKFTLKIYFN